VTVKWTGQGRPTRGLWVPARSVATTPSLEALTVREPPTAVPVADPALEAGAGVVLDCVEGLVDLVEPVELVEDPPQPPSTALAATVSASARRPAPKRGHPPGPPRGRD